MYSTDLYYTRLGREMEVKNEKHRQGVTKWIYTAEVISHDGEKFTKNDTMYVCAGANDVNNDNVDDDDDDGGGTSAIPKTLKEFILIKIKTSFKTPNNDNDTKKQKTKNDER